MPKPKQYNLKPKFDADGKKLKPEKRWMIKGYLGLDPKTGLDKYTTLRGYETAQEALDAYEDARYEFKHGLRQERMEAPTVQQVYEKWLITYKDTVRPQSAALTVERYEQHIKPTFGKYLVNEITLFDIQPWATKICKEFITGQAVCGLLHRILKFAGAMGWITIDPMSMLAYPRVDKPKSNHIKNNFYTTEELRAFVAALDDNVAHGKKYAVECRTLFLFIASTGTRAGEAVGLRWSDIDFDRHEVTIQRTALLNSQKTGPTKTESSNRLLALNPVVTAALSDWQERQAVMGFTAPGTDWVFTATTAPFGRLSLNSIARWMRLVCERHNLRRITPHGLRHTKATLMAESDVNFADIAGVLGHKNAKITAQAYIHTTRDGLDNAEKIYSKILSESVWSKSGHKNT